MAGVLLKDSGLFTQPITALTYLPSGRWVRLPSAPTAFQVQSDGFVFVGETGNFLDDNVYLFGAYERPELYLLRDVLTQMRGDEGVFLDVGANVGHHALYMAQYARKVHAVEPFPPVLARMDAMIEVNRARNVTVHRVGFSNAPGALPFYAPSDDFQGNGSFDAAFAMDAERTIELPLVVGDAWLHDRGITRVDLIKIDIEGFERYGLEGLRQTLERDRPAVVMELNNAEGGFASMEQIRATFPEGYAMYEVEAPQGGRVDLFGIALGWSMYVYGPRLNGEYALRPFNGEFAPQRNVLIAPDDLVAKVGLADG